MPSAQYPAGRHPARMVTPPGALLSAVHRVQWDHPADRVTPAVVVESGEGGQASVARGERPVRGGDVDGRGFPSG